MDVQELIKRGYRALGLGADGDVLAMFDQLGGEPAAWTLCELSAFGRRRPASDVAALDLFGGLPSHFDVIGADPKAWSMNRRQTKLTVTGHFRVRPRGTWEVMVLPFTHIWSIADGRVDSVVSLLDGVELRRLAPARGAIEGPLAKAGRDGR